LAQGWRLWREGDFPGALEQAARAETGNPGFYRNAWLKAQALWSLERASEASEAAQAALDRGPALAKDRERIAALLTEAQAAMPAARAASQRLAPEAP
jgi:hypothetical protein